MFVPLAHPPGDAQADFGEALVVIDGVERKAHYLVVDLPHSDDAFVKAFPAETTEAFCDGHNAAFHDFGGVPRRIVYANTLPLRLPEVSPATPLSGTSTRCRMV